MSWTIEKRLEDCPSYMNIDVHWETKKDNAMFILQKLKKKTSETSHHCENFQAGSGLCLYCTCKKFRITTNHSKSIVIASSNDLTEIQESWNTLESFIPMFLTFHSEECRKRPLNKKEHILDMQNVVELLFTKISALIRNENKAFLHTEVEHSEIIDDFQLCFRPLGILEPILHYWPCSVWKNKYYSGMLYLTETFLCFKETTGLRKLHFPLTSLYSFEISPSYPFYCCFKFQYLCKEYCVVDLDNLLLTYSILLPVWQKAVKSYYQNLKRTFNQYSIEKLDQQKKIGRRHSADVQFSHTLRRKSLPIPSFISSITSPYHYIIPLFSNPSNDYIFTELSAVTMPLTNELINGITMVSEDLFVFQSKEKSVCIIIPISEIKQTKQLKITHDKSNKNKISVNTIKSKFQSLGKYNNTNYDDICEYNSDDTKQRLNKMNKKLNKLNNRKNASQWQTSISIKVDKSHHLFVFHYDNWEFFPFIFQKNHSQKLSAKFTALNSISNSAEWNEKQIFFSHVLTLDEKKEEKSKNDKWIKYFNIYGIGVSIIRTNELRKLILHGIPHNRRASMWQIFSSSWYRKSTSERYSHYLEKSQLECPTETFHEIEKDLKRSMPENPFYKKAQSLESLRRILVAFATKNKYIGYCQGMNYVSSLLLLFLSEEEAFMALCKICEDIAVDYYTPSMIGAIIDLEVFGDLMKKYLPDLYSHLMNTVSSLQYITIPWFLSLFIGILPWEISFRFFDLLFSEGARAIFIYALAIFHAHQKSALLINNIDDINRFKDIILHSDQKIFIKSVLYLEDVITQYEIESLRDEQTPIILRDNPPSPALTPTDISASPRYSYSLYSSSPTPTGDTPGNSYSNLLKSPSHKLLRKHSVSSPTLTYASTSLLCEEDFNESIISQVCETHSVPSLLTAPPSPLVNSDSEVPSHPLAYSSPSSLNTTSPDVYRQSKRNRLIKKRRATSQLSPSSTFTPPSPTLKLHNPLTKSSGHNVFYSGNNTSPINKFFSSVEETLGSMENPENNNNNNNYNNNNSNSKSKDNNNNTNGDYMKLNINNSSDDNIIDQSYDNQESKEENDYYAYLNDEDDDTGDYNYYNNLANSSTNLSLYSDMDINNSNVDNNNENCTIIRPESSVIYINNNNTTNDKSAFDLSPTDSYLSISPLTLSIIEYKLGANNEQEDIVNKSNLCHNNDKNDTANFTDTTLIQDINLRNIVFDGSL